MNQKSRRQRGFTLIEITLVIIVMGILMAGLAPMLLRQHSSTMEERDRVALEDAKTAIINHAISFGGIPDPMTTDASGAIVIAAPSSSPVIGAMPPSATEIATLLPFAVPSFGVNNWGAYGGPNANLLRLDVNNALKVSSINALTGATSAEKRVAFCQAVNQQMALTASPQICQNFDDRTAICASVSPAAFVLSSTGTDRRPNQENDETSAVTGVDNRIYENDKRGINNTPGASLYDDQVKSYPLSAFARDCREKMGIALETMSCPPGYKYFGTITNTNTNVAGITYAFTRPSATPGTPPVLPVFPILGTLVPGQTASINACTYSTDTLKIGDPAAAPLTSVDTNGDGRVDALITGTTTTLRVVTYQ